MKPGIRVTRAWADDDVVDLRIEVSDGTSFFSNRVSVERDALDDAVSALATFQGHIRAGLLDVSFGRFGPEYAGGAFLARFHFPAPGRLHVTCEQESAFGEFSRRQVASRATLYLRSEPVLLDRFVAELESLAARRRGEAWLEGVSGRAGAVTEPGALPA
jgi:hypothetical protein